jgi:competence protein ComEA
MEGVSKQQLAVYAAAALAIALIGGRYLKDTSQGAAEPARSSPVAGLSVRTAPSRVFVHVTGAVRHPGVYRIPAWGRLDLAVERAGGAKRSADLEGVNLAAKVADGQQIVVPRRGVAAESAGGEASAGGAGQAGPISLNTATADQLDELDGVGPATAEKILAWRKEHGGFRSVEDLKQISGIGPKRFEALKDKVRM